MARFVARFPRHPAGPRTHRSPPTWSEGFGSRTTPRSPEPGSRRKIRLDDPGDKNLVFRCSCQEGNGSPRRTEREPLGGGMVIRLKYPFVARPRWRRRKAAAVSCEPREPGIARWRRWQRMLEDGTYGSRAELARGEGVSRAAVTMGLRKLAAGRHSSPSPLRTST